MNKIIEIINKHNSKFIYRGVPNKDYKLLPSLHRDPSLGGVGDYGNFYEDFIKEISKEFKGLINGTEIFLLEYMQHFDIKTNLLDFTRNICVALYFACNEKYDSDGKLYILNQTKYEEFLKNKNIPSSKFNISSDNILKYFKNYNDNGVIIEDGVGITFPIIIEASKKFDRIINQEGLFMLWGSEINSLEELLISHNVKDEILEEIIIKKEYKKNILKYINDNFNISEDFLMINTKSIYDRIDNLCKKKDYIKYKKNK